MAADPRATILVVDDHLEMARLLGDQLADAGYTVKVAAGGDQALRLARQHVPDLVIADLRMEGVDGLDVMKGMHGIDPEVPVLIMTAFGAIDSAVEAMKSGAYHYLTKPFQLSEVLVHVERALSARRIREENRTLRRLAEERCKLDAMVGRSAPMRALYDLVERVARANAPALIRGESGTGKELVARALHFLGPRREYPFVAVNCTTLPATLLESELFGHVRGSFTGAGPTRRGLFIEADGGSLFLDEIGDMPADLQARLLRVIQDGEVRAVGADVSRKVDVRIIAATHQALEKRVEDGCFRADLFYRLNVVPIVVPSLAERREDIPVLAEHFLRRAREHNPCSPVKGLAPELVSALARRPWPGNVRQLENLLERLVIIGTREVVGLDELEHEAAEPADRSSAAGWPPSQILPLKDLQAAYIAWVIEQCGGNKTRAADVLGIDVSTIHRRERGTR